MSKTFRFDRFAGHDLYHLRYGKGAIIIAVPQEDAEESRVTWTRRERELSEQSRVDTKPMKKQLVELRRRSLGHIVNSDERRRCQEEINSQIAVLERYKSHKRPIPRLLEYPQVVRRPSIGPSRRCRAKAQPPDPGNRPHGERRPEHIERYDWRL